jgi:hypothetical protein
MPELRLMEQDLYHAQGAVERLTAGSDHVFRLNQIPIR